MKLDMPCTRHTIAIIATIGVLAPGCGDDGETTSGATTGSGASTSTTGGAGGEGAAGGGGGAAVTCGESLCQATQPAPSCMMCIGANCLDVFTACQNDPGASTGGAGGAGGAAAPCETCAALLADPSIPPAALCPGSSLLWDPLLACVCGDRGSPGSCNP